MTAQRAEELDLGGLPWSLSAHELLTRGQKRIDEAAVEIGALAAETGPSSLDGFLAPFDRAVLKLRDTSSHAQFLFNVHPDETVRTAGRELSETAERSLNALRLNTEVYRRLKELDLGPADAATRWTVQRMVREMLRAGVKRDAVARGKILELNDEIDRTCNAFSENAAKRDRYVALNSAEELSGLPADYVGAHGPGPDGKIRITTSYPDTRPLLAYAERSDVRRRVLHEFMNRAHPENDAVLRRLMELRFALAQELGYSSFADLQVEDRMVERTGVVRLLLRDVAQLLRSGAVADRKLLLERKRRDDPGAARLEPWDASFFSEGFYDTKVRAEEFGVDARALRAYLPYGAVRDGLFQLCQELFDLKFERVTEPSPWHPSVEAYDVRRGGKLIGRSFLDMVPRDGKYGHAACFTVREGIRGVQLPQNALVCNFVDPSVPKETARMEYRDVVTFFHEFGHLLHGLFAGDGPWLYATTPEWDFIEAPSQLFEEWARDPPTLARFARDPDSGATIPPELLARLKKADAMGRRALWIRQVALSAISLEIYDRDPKGLDPHRVFQDGWDRHFPEPMPESYHPADGFGHLTGYGAAYYTYLWSLVIARDLLRPFQEKGSLTDPEIARRYAREILAPGGSRPAAELIQNFLGREFDLRAFEAWVQEGSRAP
jgi:thimet oligopeptidase